MMTVSDSPSIRPSVNGLGQLSLEALHAPAGAMIRYAFPWEGPRVLFINGAYLAPIDPVAGLEVRYRLFAGKKGVGGTGHFTFPAAGNAPLQATSLVACTQNRDFSAYAWENRHEAVLHTVRDRRPGLVFLGDSITHFFGGDPKDPCATDIHRVAPDLWDVAFGRWNPVNLGFGNDRIENALWRVTHGELDGVAENALCVLLIGTNNMKVNTDEEIVIGVERLCREIRSRVPGGKVLLQGIYPRTASPGRREAINRMLSELSLGGVLYASPGEALAGPDGYPAPGLTRDGIHPTREGYRLVAEELSALIAHLTG